jgi:type I restriction enzyme, S subunit
MAVESVVGAAPDGWERTTLGDICAKGGGFIQTGPFGSQLHASDYVPVGVPSIMPVNIGENRIVTDGIMRIPESDAARLGRHRVRPGDIIYSRRGDVERRALIRQEQTGWLCGTGCLLVRFGSAAIDPLYASYYLGHQAVRAWIVRHAVGITMPNLNTGIMEAIPFVLPPLPDQRRIAHILGTLDDKIDLNRRMNQTLEAMARALFKSWFIDFDPVHENTKTPGKHPLFPNGFQDSPLGRIAKGWEVCKLGDLCSTQYGFTASATPEPIGPKFLRVMDINKHDWIEWGDVPHCSIPEEGKVRYALGVGDLVVARMADPGKSAIVEEPVDAVFASYLVRLKARSLAHAYFVYGFLKSQAYAEYSEGAMSGSVQANMNARVIVDAQLAVPHDTAIEAYLPRILPLRRQLAANNRENSLLAALRDSLLPKLLSGDLRIAAAKELST